MFCNVIHPDSAIAGKHLPLVRQLGALSSSGNHKLKGTNMPAMWLTDLYICYCGPAC